MSAHVLLNLLNELRNRDKKKCETRRVFYLFFATSLIYSIIRTRTRMLDSIYHMTLRLL